MRVIHRFALVALLSGGTTLAAGASGDVWVGAWGFPPTPVPVIVAAPAAGAGSVAPVNPALAAPPDFDNVTIRQIVRISAPAERIRIRLSNEFGNAPMRLGAVHVALAGEDGAVVPGSDHVLTFSGRGAGAIAADAPLISDPIDWKLPALTKLAVSIFLPEATIPPAHRVSEYVSSSGNFTDAEQLPGAQLVRTGALVSAVDVVSPLARHVLVTLGDSITEGFGSTTNAFRGWSDRLAERVAQTTATRGWSVVNAGINSNRLLHNDPGEGALARLDRDVLAVPGVSMVLMLEGINDIGYSHTRPAEAVSADDIIAAYRQIIARLHAHGVAVVAATITPFEDSHYYTAQGELMRQAVNRWIRSSGAFDGVVDFDAVMRDPDHPTQVRASMQRGDHLHPNDAGYAAMGDAIDLKLLRAR
jgi:lysophospholipase L1-like esterase